MDGLLGCAGMIITIVIVDICGSCPEFCPLFSIYRHLKKKFHLGSPRMLGKAFYVCEATHVLELFMKVVWGPNWQGFYICNM